MARRSRGTYPQGYVTSEQRRQGAKEPAGMFKLFCRGALDMTAWHGTPTDFSAAGETIDAMAEGRWVIRVLCHSRMFGLTRNLGDGGCAL